jgi:hypothetical protein
VYKHLMVDFDNNDGQCRRGRDDGVFTIVPTPGKSAIDRFLKQH